MYYVYVLYSPSIDQFYRGQTRDLADRLHRHNNRQESSTQKGAPWTLIWFTTKPDRSSALDLEQKLKNLSRKRLIRLMEKYDENYPGQGLHPAQ